MIQPTIRSFVWGDSDLVTFLKGHYPRLSEDFSTFFEESGDLKQSVFTQAFAKVDPKKTPGSPMCFLAQTNDQLRHYYDGMYEIVNKRLKKFEELGKEIIKHDAISICDHVKTAVALVGNGFSDPVLLGVKGEPRPVENGIPKRPRLVSQVSVLQNLLARIILGNHLITEQSYTDLPTATALDLTTPEETARLFNLFKAQSELHKVMTNDVQGFEYSVNEHDAWAGWFKESWCMGLISDAWLPVPGKEKHFYTHLAYHFTMIHKVVQLQSGELLVVHAGQMSSGRLETYSQNSAIRAWNANLVALAITGSPVTFVKTGGDDCLEHCHEMIERYIGEYYKLGKKVTDATIMDDEFDFCSTSFTAAGCYQKNIEKSTYAIMLRKKYDDEARLAFDMCFQRHPEYLKYREIVERYAC